MLTAILAVVGLWASLASSSAAHGKGPHEVPAEGKCIKETDWMRHNHMDFLRHKRAITVREGVRVKDESLLNCATCHTSRTKFCDKCHDFVGVRPDCFECHNYPK
jgi:hypothetical protein